MKRYYLTLAVLMLFGATLCAAQAPAVTTPTITHIGAVDTNTIAVVISTDGWVRASLQAYQAQAGDEIKSDKKSFDGRDKKTLLIRGGK
ncbi:MAG: hypothetical protein PF961_14580 [Planctomycetota bacterium]|jgi:phosphate-selective porin|nr:hypothetical protein [Planctomycetota bacterium]